jgi:hypothetical protein
MWGVLPPDEPRVRDLLAKIASAEAMLAVTDGPLSPDQRIRLQQLLTGWQAELDAAYPWYIQAAWTFSPATQTPFTPTIVPTVPGTAAPVVTWNPCACDQCAGFNGDAPAAGVTARRAILDTPERPPQDWPWWWIIVAALLALGVGMNLRGAR